MISKHGFHPGTNFTDLLKRPVVLNVLYENRRSESCGPSHPLSRAALADLLAGDGYRVFQSDNANSAILCVDQNTHLAVLLVDLDMPGWKSLIRHAQAVAPQALIVAMLGTRAFAEDPDLKGRGIFVCLPKPIVYPHLQQAIRSDRKSGPDCLLI